MLTGRLRLDDPCETVQLQRGSALKRTVIGGPPGGAPSPNAYLVQQEPFSEVDPHFHLNSQFQVIVAGSGALGRHAVAPLTVHYASRQTGYGPVTAGPDGLWYFTLRPAIEKTGPHFIATSRHLVDRSVPKYQVTSPPHTPYALRSLQLLRDAETVTLLTPETRGLGAWLLRVPPNCTTPSLSRSAGAGAFYLFTQGSARIWGATFDQYACAWIADDEDELLPEAGTYGCEFLVLQFPRDA